jgi:hypothetical protein
LSSWLWLAIIISIGPKLDMQTSRMVTFFSAVIISYLLTDCVKILLANSLKIKMTPTNIFKIKKGISIVLMIFGCANNARLVSKENGQNAFENIEKNKQYCIYIILKPLLMGGFFMLICFSLQN